MGGCYSEAGEQTPGFLFPTDSGFGGRTYLGPRGSLKGGSVARVTAGRQEALLLVTSPARGRDNGALFWARWDRETSPH